MYIRLYSMRFVQRPYSDAADEIAEATIGAPYRNHAIRAAPKILSGATVRRCRKALGLAFENRYPCALYHGVQCKR